MTSGAAGEFDYIAVRSLDDLARQCHRIETQFGQHLGHALPIELGYGGLGNFHVASSLGGFIGHVVPSASE
jgi:hypothetical protein